MNDTVRDRTRDRLCDALRAANAMLDDEEGDASYCCRWRHMAPPVVYVDEGVELHPLAFVSVEEHALYLTPDTDVAHPELVDAASTAGWEIRQGGEVLR